MKQSATNRGAAIRRRPESQASSEVSSTAAPNASLVSTETA